MKGPITIVSGLPRSGTSLMMQVLAAGGLPALTDGMRSADESNPRGYFEFDPVKRLRSDRTWIGQAEGRAVKVIHLLLRELPVDPLFQYRVIFMHRPLVEILASQRAMLARQGKPAINDAVLEKVYVSQLLQAEEWLTRSDIPSLRVEYHQVLADPGKAAKMVNTFLGANLDVTAMAAAVDATLYRQRLAGDAKRTRS